MPRAHARDRAAGRRRRRRRGRAAALDAWAAKRLATFEDAERGLAFGRLDFETVARPLYVGRRWVHDDEGDQVVVNWQAPAARPFYTATPQDPHGVTLRRRFRTQGRKLVDIADEALDGSALDGASVNDFLLEELERSRETHMRDIVATIQADQYRLITREPNRPLVIQGGPGTGKTAVGLHRASWLIYTERERNARSRVLVVGPNRTFMEYVSHVLPALGEGSVEQLAVSELVVGIEPMLRDPPAVVRLKADTRMAEVIARAAKLRLAAAPEELILKLEGQYVRVRVREQQRLLEEIREQHGTTAAARERFRMAIVRSFYSEYGRLLQGAAVRDGEEVEKALRANGYLNRVLERAWPAVTATKLVRALFTTPAFLAEAATGILDEAEQRLLRRRAAGWSDADVALLDEAHALVGEPARTYDHVIVDEAQDLSPMQLRMIARRARGGALTILGDVAQGTGPVTCTTTGRTCFRTSPRGGDAEVEELRYAYRVPREIMELALPLLDVIAPGIERPHAYRLGASAPQIRQVAEDGLLREAYREAARLAREDGLVALIVPDELVEPALAHESAFDSIPLLTPREAKGLEFDHVIVVEPGLVAAHPQGLRELYVALTRPTTTLVVLHARCRPSSASRVRPMPELWIPGMAGPLEDLVRTDPPPDRRLRVRARARAGDGRGRAGGRLPVPALVALGRSRLRLPHPRPACGRRGAAGADRPDRVDPSAHAESGRAREPDRILPPQRMSRGERERDDVEPDVAGRDAAGRVALRHAGTGDRDGPLPGAERGAVELEPGDDQEDAGVDLGRAPTDEVDGEERRSDRAADVSSEEGRSRRRSPSRPRPRARRGRAAPGGGAAQAASAAPAR